MVSDSSAPRAAGEPRARILAAARAVLAERGEAEVSLRAVARRAGFTPGALYTHFANRDALFLALAAEALAEATRALRAERAVEPSRALPFFLRQAEALPLAPALLAAILDPDRRRASPTEARLFMGRLITLLLAVAPTRGPRGPAQAADAVLRGAEALGLALLDRSGCLAAWGVDREAVLARLADRDAPAQAEEAG